MIFTKIGNVLLNQLEIKSDWLSNRIYRIFDGCVVWLTFKPEEGGGVVSFYGRVSKSDEDEM